MNRSMEKISEGLRLAKAEKEAFRRTMLRVAAEAASLGDCFDETRRALEATLEMERLASSERLRELEEAERKIRRSIEERARELQSSEVKVGVVKFQLDATSRDLEARKEELRGVEELLASRRTELVVKRKELEQILAKIEESTRVWEESERRSRESSLQLWPYHHPTVNQNEGPSQERGFPQSADSVNPGEKIKSEPLNSLPYVSSTVPTDTCQNLLYLTDDSSNTVNRFFAEAYACGLDPAKVVLDMIKGSPHLLQSSWDAADLSLLEQLMELSPAMTREVTERAFELAIKWKIKLEDKRESKCSALGFLHFLAAYKLMPSFDTSQIRLLAEACSLSKSHPELCLALGLTAENDVAVSHHRMRYVSPGSGRPDRGSKRPSSTLGQAYKQPSQESQTR